MRAARVSAGLAALLLAAVTVGAPAAAPPPPPDDITTVGSTVKLGTASPGARVREVFDIGDLSQYVGGLASVSGQSMNNGTFNATVYPYDRYSPDNSTANEDAWLVKAFVVTWFSLDVRDADVRNVNAHATPYGNNTTRAEMLARFANLSTPPNETRYVVVFENLGAKTVIVNYSAESRGTPVCCYQLPGYGVLPAGGVGWLLITIAAVILVVALGLALRRVSRR
jgi:hypothetical protein